MYTPFDPSSPEHRGNVSMAFIGQSVQDIRNKLQRLEGLQDYSLQDLMREAEKIYNKRETPEKIYNKRETPEAQKVAGRKRGQVETRTGRKRRETRQKT